MTPALAVALAALTAAPAEVLVVRRDTATVAPAVADKVVKHVIDGLTAEGVAARETTTACGGSVGCLAKTATDAHAAVAIGVTVLKARKGVSVDVEAVDAAGTALGAETFLVPPAGEPLPPEAAALFRRIAAAAVPVVADDAPKRVELAPAAPVEVAAAPSSPLLKVAFVGAGVTGVAAAGLAVAGFLTRATLQTKLAQPVVPGTRAQAQGEATLTNGLLVGALISTLVAVAAGATAVLLWGSEDG